MRNILMAAALGAAVMTGGAIVLSTQARAQVGTAIPAAGLTGDWAGGYVSSDGNDVNTFNVKLRQTGGTISGTIYEVNVFGDTSRALFLTSTFTGTLANRQVRFTKTYDGSGGASHAVTYTGTLEPNGRRIRGTFNASGSTGTFEMVR